MSPPGGLALLLAVALAAPSTAREGSIRFAEVASEWGIDFRHHHGGSGERYMVETVIGGVVMFDFDDDGDEDLFFVDGAPLPGYRGEPPRSRLYRNDGEVFVDFTDASGIDFDGYGNGGAAADYDGDGDLDLYLTAFGANALWENLGDGRFRDVSEPSGVAETLWSSAAAFADVEADGDLDLFVGNYVDFGLDNHKFCGDPSRDLQAYCHPGAFNGLPDTFYRNRGDGSFEEATAAAGLDAASLATLALSFGDLDDDGWVDLYVANDAHQNLFYRNRGDGSFEEMALLAGVAFGDAGNPEAGMGVELGDTDGDGRLDVFVTNFELETNVLYRNLGGGVFIDARFASNVAETSLLQLAFGVALADLDNDGDLDLVIANGHILDNAVEFNKASRYGQANQVLENLGDGRFAQVVDAGFELELASRGLAAGDLDRDGDLDLAISNSNERAEVYENRSAARPWLQVDLRRRRGNTRGVGARLTLHSGAGARPQEVRSGSSYASQHALTLHFGLGAAEPMEGLEVRWPEGTRQLYRGAMSGRYRLVDAER